MNWLDIIVITVMIFILIGSIVLEVIAVQDKEYSMLVGILVMGFVAIMFVGGLFFMVIDKSSGSTQGVITSVDKNFFGTTAVYIKTSESSQEEYCVEDNKIATIASENIGKKVIVKYGKRVGLYSTGRCHQGPIEDIKLVENE